MVFKLTNDALNESFDTYLKSVLPENSKWDKEVITKDMLEHIIYMAYAQGWYESIKREQT